MAELEQLKGKNWVAAMTLCWFFGPIGGHRFYTGKQGTAWAMFALSIIGLFPITWIWSLVDGVMLAMGNYKHEDGADLYEKIDWYGWLYVAAQVLTIIGGFLYMGVIVAMIAAGIGSAAGSASVAP